MEKEKFSRLDFLKFGVATSALAALNSTPLGLKAEGTEKSGETVKLLSADWIAN